MKQAGEKVNSFDSQESELKKVKNLIRKNWISLYNFFNINLLKSQWNVSSAGESYYN